MLRKFALIIGILFLTAHTAAAESIRLKSGRTVEGEILTRTDDSITIDVGIGVPVTYYLDEIENISKGTPAPSSGQIPPRLVSEPGSTEKISPPTPKETPLQPSVTTQDPTKTTSSITDIEKEKIGLDTTRREEHLLIDKINRQMESETAGDPKEAFISKKDYLKDQFEKQAKLQTQRIQNFIRELDKKLTEAFNSYIRANPKFKQLTSPKQGLAPILGVIAGVYAIFCIPFMLIARKFHLSGLMAWIPILQLILFVRMANKSFWWFLLLCIPIINLFVVLALCIDITKRLQKPAILGWLMIVPGLNLLILWYLALAKIHPDPSIREQMEEKVHRIH
mgnify:CR=1 FL=1